MNISALIQLLKTLFGTAFSKRNSKDQWEGWIDVHGQGDDPDKIVLNGKFKAVSIELSGLKFVIGLDDGDVTLEAKPDIHNPHHLSVFINGVLDPEARVANPKLKSTPTHPFRTAVDIRPVTWNGDETRFNLRFKG